MGTPAFAVPVLQAMIDHPQINVVGVVTAPDRVAGSAPVEFNPTKQRALQKNIPVLQPAKIRKNPEFEARLKALSPDLIVVAAYGKILPQEILDLPKYGAINIHPSMLPKYRGASPVVGAVLAGDKETGVTIIRMTTEMDAGDIIKMGEPVSIKPTDTALALIHKLFEEGATMLTEIIVPYIEKRVAPVPQDESRATYVELLTSEQGRIDWHQDAAQIDRMIRAYLPWPGTYTFWQGKRLKILSATPMVEANNTLGQAKAIDGDLYIGKLRIDRLQLEGKNAMSGAEFLRGYPQFPETFVIE